MAEVRLAHTYGVDNRRSELKEATDNEAGRNFLQRYRAKQRATGQNLIGDERKYDDRFFIEGEGGIENANARITFRNAFRAGG
jgi:hypothetical protein